MRKPKKDFRLSLRKSLLKKMDMKMPKSDLQLEEDPFLRLGFGMNAYFDTLFYLMIMMVFISVFSLPSMYIYSSYSGIRADAMGSITQFSLGNMGGASTLCKQAPSSVLSLPLKCKNGIFKASEAEFGIIPNFALKTNQCSEDAITSPCSSRVNKSGL